MNMGKSSVIVKFTDGLRNICPYSFELHATNRQEVAPCMPALKQELPYKRSLDPKISTGRAAVLD